MNKPLILFFSLIAFCFTSCIDKIIDAEVDSILNPEKTTLEFSESWSVPMEGDVKSYNWKVGSLYIYSTVDEDSQVEFIAIDVVTQDFQWAVPVKFKQSNLKLINVLDDRYIVEDDGPVLTIFDTETQSIVIDEVLLDFMWQNMDSVYMFNYSHNWRKGVIHNDKYYKTLRDGYTDYLGTYSFNLITKQWAKEFIYTNKVGSDYLTAPVFYQDGNGIEHFVIVVTEDYEHEDYCKKMRLLDVIDQDQYTQHSILDIESCVGVNISLLNNKTVTISLKDNNYYLFDLETQSLINNYQSTLFNYPKEMYVHDNEFVISYKYNGICAFSLLNEEVLWEKGLAFSIDPIKVSADDNLVYYKLSNSDVKFIELSNGAEFEINGIDFSNVSLPIYYPEIDQYVLHNDTNVLGFDLL